MRAEAQAHVDRINEALALLRRFLDWDRALRRLDELNARVEDPTLWDDPKAAQEVMRERRRLDEAISATRNIERELADTSELIELADAEGDEAMASEGVEALAQLAFADRSHAALRDALLEAAFTRQPLESAALPTILAEAGLSDVANGLRTPNGLAFSFLRGNADRTQAERDLAAAIRALAERPELDEALAAATKRLMASPDEAGFAEQRRARAARDEADRTLAALAQGDGGNGL